MHGTDATDDLKLATVCFSMAYHLLFFLAPYRDA